MRHLALFVAVAGAAVIIGCGGGGGNSPATSGTVATGTVATATTSTATTSGDSYSLQVVGADPMNLRYGHKYELRFLVNGKAPTENWQARSDDALLDFGSVGSGPSSVSLVRADGTAATVRAHFDVPGGPAKATLPIRFVKGDTFTITLRATAGGSPAAAFKSRLFLNETPYDDTPSENGFSLPQTVADANGEAAILAPMNHGDLLVLRWSLSYSRAMVNGVLYDDLPARIPIPTQTAGGNFDVDIEYLLD